MKKEYIKLIILGILVLLTVTLAFIFITQKNIIFVDDVQIETDNYDSIFGKKECIKDDNNINHKELIYFDKSNAIVEIENIITYTISSDEEYSDFEDLSSNCKDDYKKNNTITCKSKLNYEGDSLIGTWTYSYTKQLESDGYTCK